jgi:methylase of polypeptide subunit release factors
MENKGLQLSTTADAPLLTLLTALEADDFDFTPPTPATHARVVARAGKRQGHDLRDIFGWSLPFAADALPGAMLAALRDANAVEQAGGLLKSKLRVARVGSGLFLHSAYPTTSEHSVFLGPDSYRFVRFLWDELRQPGARRLVDLGAGAGVGAIMASALLPGARITLLDINPQALQLAAINARHAGLDVELVEGEAIDDVEGLVDLVIANPPYIIDEDGRAYRDGGGMHGAEISLEWSVAAAQRLERGGRMLLYTGSAIVDGRDALKQALERDLPALGCSLRYAELDPDVFGEELEKPAYADVDRIAIVGAVIEKG